MKIHNGALWSILKEIKPLLKTYRKAEQKNKSGNQGMKVQGAKRREIALEASGHVAVFCSVLFCFLRAFASSEHGARGWGSRKKAKQMALLRGRKPSRTSDHPMRLEKHKLET